MVEASLNFLRSLLNKAEFRRPSRQTWLYEKLTQLCAPSSLLSTSLYYRMAHFKLRILRTFHQINHVKEHRRDIYLNLSTKSQSFPIILEERSRLCCVCQQVKLEELFHSRCRESTLYHIGLV